VDCLRGLIEIFREDLTPFSLSLLHQIRWPDRWTTNNPHLHGQDTEVFLVSVDGIHCKVQEPKHPFYPKNPAMYSHKFHSAGLNYEVAISVFENKVVWVNGPFQASTHDITVFRNHGLANKIPPGKRCIGDKGYRGEPNKVSVPSSFDTEPVRRLKGRARARQESFNSRLKQFECLYGTFRHDLSKHKTCFEAVCVICQFQMENGNPLFQV